MKGKVRVGIEDGRVLLAEWLDRETAWAGLSPATRDLGEIAGVRLAAVLADALALASRQLLVQGASQPDHAHVQSCADAADLARARGTYLVQSFRRHFDLRYGRACGRRPNPLGGQVVDFDASQLRIVAHELLEDSLDTDRLAEAIQDASWSEMPALARGCRTLLGQADIRAADLPLAPKLIADAVADALREQPWRQAGKYQLAKALCRTLPAGVRALYQDLAAHLDARLPAHGYPPAQPAGLALPLEAETVDMAMPPATAPALPTLPDLPVLPAEAPTCAEAQVAVAQCLDGHSLPDTVRDFLSGPWQAFLARVHAEAGADSTEWLEALATMDDLAWAVTIAGNPADSQRQARGLSGLFTRLDAGLRTLGTPPEVRSRLFVQLAESHAHALAATLALAAEATIPRDAPPLAIRVVPDPIPAEPRPAAPARPRRGAGRVAPAALECGTWLAYSEADGSVAELKLAWISPHRGLYLLTNRQGERALSLTADELALALAQCRLRIMSEATAGDSQVAADQTRAAKRQRAS